RTYYPYYQADIEAGRLTREQAKELIKFFWIKWYSRTRGVQNGKNFLFGGQHADGSDVTNELTYVALEAYEELNAPDPKLSVRFFPGTPDRLYDRVPDLIRKGHNSFVLMNDVPAVEGVVRQGKSLADARTFLPIGCYEPAVDGKEAGCTMNIIVNLAKPIELALHDGIDPRSGQRVGPATGLPESFVNFEAFYAAYARQLDHIVERAVACTAVHEAQWPQINPSPLIAGTIDDCLARGKDIGEGGAHYNSVGCVGVGLANAADSLLSVKQVVFADHGMSLPEFVAMLDTDYAGREAERQLILKQVPKWGNGHPEADGLAKRVSETYCGRVNALVNGRGGPVQAALFSLNHRIHFGRDTGALPDGRRAGESLSPGVGPMPGMDRKGVTALLKSAGGLDYVATPNGAVLDVTLHPSAVRGREGLQAMVGLIKTFFSMGGYALQFNVCDAETLRAAQQEPEKYAGLQIRVTGWSAHFVTLPKDQQDHFIALTTHRV
ncbi:MAG: hypothetical protein HN849_20325, partial [Victivallales bacterium]|nr:hypothetical protein [Victivallales bacterium]